MKCLATIILALGLGVVDAAFQQSAANSCQVKNSCTAKDANFWTNSAGCSTAGSATGTTLALLGAPTAATGYICELECKADGGAFTVRDNGNVCKFSTGGAPAANGVANADYSECDGKKSGEECVVTKCAAGYKATVAAGTDAGKVGASKKVNCNAAGKLADGTVAGVTNSLSCAENKCNAKTDAQWKALGCIITTVGTSTVTLTSLGTITTVAGWATCTDKITCPTDGGDFAVDAAVKAETCKFSTGVAPTANGVANADYSECDGKKTGDECVVTKCAVNYKATVAAGTDAGKVGASKKVNCNAAGKLADGTVAGVTNSLSCAENTCTAMNAAAWALTGCTPATVGATKVSGLGTITATAGWDCTGAITCPVDGQAFVVNAKLVECDGGLATALATKAGNGNWDAQTETMKTQKSCDTYTPGCATNFRATTAGSPFTIICDATTKDVQDISADQTLVCAENECTAKADADAWKALGCTVAGTATGTKVSQLGTVGVATAFGAGYCDVTCPVNGEAFVVKAGKGCTAKADADAWKALGCVVAGTATGTNVKALGTITAAEGYASCEITCPTKGDAFKVNAVTDAEAKAAKDAKDAKDTKDTKDAKDTTTSAASSVKATALIFAAVSAAASIVV